MKKHWIRIAVAAFSSVGAGAQAQRVDILPKPLSLKVGKGAFVINSQTRITFNPSAKSEAQTLADFLKQGTGLKLRTQSKPHAASIRYEIDPTATELGAEGYRLKVTSSGIQAVAFKTAGLFYATQSIAQLLPAQVFAKGSKANIKWAAPSVEIQDKPRFGWRGMHLDVSRHFYAPSFIKRYIDLLSMHKMNIFHWHLLDDGGWRMESKKYPLLTSQGAWRSSPLKGHWDYGNITFPKNPTGPVYGGFYTQSEIRDIVAYASKRHVTVVPEIEMPGHNLPAIACYPNIGCVKPDGVTPIISSNYCPGNEEAFKFLENVLDETMSLFPSKYIHIGGDEVDKTDWKVCPKCAERIKSEGLKDVNELQSYFIRRIEKYLNSKGRQLIGWDEILEGGLAPNATVMSWRGEAGGIEAVKQGKHAVMSPTSHAYFDYPYDNISTDKVYLYNPVPAEVKNSENLILGAQGNVWTEWLPQETDVERMAYPRAIAMAEATWCPADVRDLTDFHNRLKADYARLDYLNVSYKMPMPTAGFSAVLFTDQAEVTLDTPTMQGLTLRYTTDGTAPTSKSPAYRGPIKVEKSCIIAASYFRANGTHGDITYVGASKYTPKSVEGLQPGLVCNYYQVAVKKIPDFDQLTPTATSIVSDINISMKQRPETFALNFKGYLMIPQDGVYTFTLSSDDGSRLFLADALVVDNEGLHAAQKKMGRIKLKAGAYPIDIRYFDSEGGNSLSLEVEGPGLPLQAVSGSITRH